MLIMLMLIILIMLLTNGSEYKIFNVEHTIREDLIIKKPIPMTDILTLEELCIVIKRITTFLETNEIDYLDIK